MNNATKTATATRIATMNATDIAVTGIGIGDLTWETNNATYIATMDAIKRLMQNE